MIIVVLARLATVVCAMAVAACGGSGGGGSGNAVVRAKSSETATGIVKGEVFPHAIGETTPVVFNDELLYVGATYDADGRHTKVYRQSGELLSDRVTGLGMPSALVHNGALYVFGTNADQHGGTDISVISTTDLANWTEPAPVFHAPAGTKLFNTSVAPDPTGFVMAYEVCEDGKICFNARFLHSTNLVTWSPIGGVYEVGYYTACPTIRHVDGYYYLFFLSMYKDADPRGYFATNVARSADLRTWSMSPATVLSPFDGGDSSRNASDMDLVEVNGKTRIVYQNGSQWGEVIPNAGLREATYAGSLANFVAIFF